MFGTPGRTCTRAVRRRRPGGAPHDHVAGACGVRRHHGAASSGRPGHRHVSGTVIDNTSQVVPGATVTLTNEATADARTTVSGERGEFAFRAVDAGSYTVGWSLPDSEPPSGAITS